MKSWISYSSSSKCCWNSNLWTCQFHFKNLRGEHCGFIVMFSDSYCYYSVAFYWFHANDAICIWQKNCQVSRIFLSCSCFVHGLVLFTQFNKLKPFYKSQIAYLWSFLDLVFFPNFLKFIPYLLTHKVNESFALLILNSFLLLL